LECSLSNFIGVLSNLTNTAFKKNVDIFTVDYYSTMEQDTSKFNNTDHLDLNVDIHSQNFNVIRLASYRTAVKFRFIQRRTHLHLIDVWNLIEAFRENGLNSVEPYTPMTLSRLETLIVTLYVHLNKRVPIGQQLHVHPASLYLMKWIVSVFNLKEDSERIPVFTIKMVLAVLCGGKLAEKLRYGFSQMSDSNGQLVASKFEDFLKQCFALTAAVGEEPSFHYKPGIVQAIFPSNSKVSVNDFLDILLGDPAIPCLVWLPLLHRIAAAEQVVHPVECISCNRSRFTGLRYTCSRCPSAWSHQCQECFWRGLSLSDSHKADHEIHEYHTPKSPSKHSSLSTSLRRSFQCVRSPESDYRDTQQSKIWRNLEGPERPVAVTYTSSAASTLQRSSTLGKSDTANWKGSSVNENTGSLNRSGWNRSDDEHGLIARYAAKLADDNISASQLDMGSSAHQLLAQLENKNQEILRQIARIRREQESGGDEGSGNFPLMEELSVLRQRKSELETQLTTLQDSRKHMMGQLESLMKMIKTQQHSPRSTPSSSSSRGKSPSIETDSLREAADGSGRFGLDSAMDVCGGGDNSGRQSNMSFDWRQDLLSAADSVTDAMSSLVFEYNGDSDEETGPVYSNPTAAVKTNGI